MAELGIAVETGVFLVQKVHAVIITIIIFQTQWATLKVQPSNVSTAGTISSKPSKTVTSVSSKSTAKNKSTSTMLWSSNDDSPPHKSTPHDNKLNKSEEDTPCKVM